MKIQIIPPLKVFGLGTILLLVLFMVHLTQGQANLDLATVIEAIFSPKDTADHNIVRYLRLPRATLGILAGAALGMAGTVLQTITRNPLASPATLGINAGAYLAVTLAVIFSPGLFSISPTLIALVGGLFAAILAYAIAGAVRATPLRLTLAGVAVSLALSAMTAALQLIYENETSDLFFWGAGSLAQIDWSRVQYAAPRITISTILLLSMARALDVLSLGEEVARSLGNKIQFTRVLSTLLAVFLAAIVVSVSGPIGFVGLVAPHLVKLMGCRKHRLLLLGAALWGAIMLVGADIIAQRLTTNLNDLPTGSVTALIGAPFLIWLASTSKQLGGDTPSVSTQQQTSSRRFSYPVLLSSLLSVLLIIAIAGILLGNRTIDFNQLIDLLSGNETALSQTVILNLRLPRLLVAMVAGATLAVSGLLLQGVVRNPLAGPEIVGVTSGAGLGAMIVLVLVPNATPESLSFAAMIGAVSAFGCVYLLSWKKGVLPARLALIGIAVSAFCSAGINVLVVLAKLRVAQAIVWLSGSTYARQWDELGRLLILPVLLLPIVWLFARRLDVLALGEDVPRILGMSLQRVRAAMIAIAVVLSAAAVSTVGTISFVGLIAPHAGRLLVGYRHRQLVPIVAILGAILVSLADVVGRVAIAPREIPSGLVTAMIGAPYFLWLILSNRKQ
ncbi:MAG: iron ABC transporter permease [Leptolyngbya sp. Prado105]|jgi:iron complex transport system permease protein|nr:iron ABC transporter permease [Leptolyngbya sp. Prado105]